MADEFDFSGLFGDYGYADDSAGSFASSGGLSDNGISLGDLFSGGLDSGSYGDFTPDFSGLLGDYSFGDDSAGSFDSGFSFGDLFNSGNYDSGVSLDDLIAPSFDNYYNPGLESFYSPSVGSYVSEGPSSFISSLIEGGPVDMGGGIGIKADLARDALGGTLLDTSGKNPTFSYLNGDKAGIKLPNADGTGLKMYTQAQPVDPSELGNTSIPRTSLADRLAVNDYSRRDPSPMDLIAAQGPDENGMTGLDKLRAMGVTDERAAVQYDLANKFTPGESYINNAEDAKRYAQVYSGMTESTALGGLLNPINRAAEFARTLNAITSANPGISTDKARAAASQIVAQKAEEQAKKLGTTSGGGSEGGGNGKGSEGGGKGGTSTTNGIKTGLKAAAGLAQIAKILQGNRGGGMAAVGNKGPGATGWSVGRAAGSGRKKMASGGLALVQDKMSRGGQADRVPAMLSGGEYVMDADVVSALGDGSTQAGAAKLDQMRENIRSHKRASSSKGIPPKSKDISKYLKG